MDIFGKQCCHCNSFEKIKSYNILDQNYYFKTHGTCTTILKHKECDDFACYRYVCNKCTHKEPEKNQQLLNNIKDLEKTLNNIFLDTSQIIIDYFNFDTDDILTCTDNLDYKVTCGSCYKLLDARTVLLEQISIRVFYCSYRLPLLNLEGLPYAA
jgi:hypothetical protein